VARFFFDNGELLCGLLKFPDVFPIKENNRVVDDRLFRRTAATRVFRSSSAEKRLFSAVFASCPP